MFNVLNNKTGLKFLTINCCSYPIIGLWLKSKKKKVNNINPLAAQKKSNHLNYYPKIIHVIEMNIFQ